MPMRFGTRLAILTRRSSSADVEPTTETFDAADEGLIWGGYFTDWAFGGTTLREGFTQTELLTVVTGTKCELRVYAADLQYAWTVDGGATQTSTPTGNTFQYITLFDGLSQGPHTISVRVAKYTDAIATLRVTGVLPAVAYPSGYSGTYRKLSQTGFALDGSAVLSTAGTDYDASIVNRAGIRFKATCTGIRIWGKSASAVGCSIIVDGDWENPIRFTAPSDNTWQWINVTQALSAGAEHDYQLIISNGVSVYSVMSVGGTINSSSPANRDLIYCIGDSITQGNPAVGIQDDTDHWPILFALQHDPPLGWKINAAGGATAFVHGQDHKGDPGANTPAPTKVVIGYGTNDQSGGSGVDTTEFRTAVDAIISQIASDLPSAKVYWFGIIDTPFTTANRDDYNAEISDGIADLADSDVAYIDTDAWTISIGVDNVHPDDAGNAEIATNLLGVIA